MTPTGKSDDRRADPRVRSRLYRLFASGFRYPTPEAFRSLRSGEFLDALGDGLESLPGLSRLADEAREGASIIRQDLGNMTLRDFEVEYARLFDVGTPGPPCPPYEGVHRKGIDRTAVLLEVSGFYRHFGLSTEGKPGGGELPDHLGAELEFLHFLAFKEAQARNETPVESEATGEAADLLAGYLLARKDFLERHLLAWLPGFAEKIGKAAAGLPFARLAKLAAGFAAADAEHLSGQLPQSTRRFPMA